MTWALKDANETMQLKKEHTLASNAKKLNGNDEEENSFKVVSDGHIFL